MISLLAPQPLVQDVEGDEGDEGDETHHISRGKIGWMMVGRS